MKAHIETKEEKKKLLFVLLKRKVKMAYQDFKSNNHSSQSNKQTNKQEDTQFKLTLFMYDRAQATMSSLKIHVRMILILSLLIADLNEKQKFFLNTFVLFIKLF